jgi:hypothetical protein
MNVFKVNFLCLTSIKKVPAAYCLCVISGRKDLINKKLKPIIVNRENHRNVWIKTGCICGLLGGCMYFADPFLKSADK